MRFSLKNTLIHFLILIAIDTSNAQNYLFELQEINVQDGLPARQVYDISQDQDGYIWISTRMGIHRFDGYSFKSYDNTFLNLPDRNPINIIIDKQNQLWYSKWKFVQGQLLGGIIDLDRDSLLSVLNLSGKEMPLNDIYGITPIESSPSEILIITKKGVLYSYGTALEEIYRMPSPLYGNFNALKTGDKNYWIVNNLKIVHINQGQVQRELLLPPYKEGFVNKILSRQNTPIFEIQTIEKEFNYYTIEKDGILPFQIKGEHSIDVKKVLQIEEGFIIYTKQDSLIVRDTLGKFLFGYQFPEGTLNFRNTFVDKQSNLWITTQNGLFKLSRTLNPFTIINSGFATYGILKDSSQLWVSGTSKYLIHDLEKNTKLVNPTPYQAISFLQDERGHILVGNRNGVLDYTPDKLITKASERHNQFKQLSINKRIKLLFQNPVTKNYWVAGITSKDSIREGYILDLENKRIGQALLPDSLLGIGIRTRQFFPDIEGVWLVANKGLFLIEPSTEQLVKHYTKKDGLPFDDLNFMYRDSSGILWLGSEGGGLIRWNKELNQFKQFTTKQGLSNNYIYTISEDDYSTLWLSSDFGLMAFDKETLITKIYLPENGIALEEFHNGVYFKDKDGTLFFGGPSGITSFHPSNLHQQKNTSLPLKLMAVRMLEKDKEKLINRTPDFLKTGKLEMKPSDRIMEIDIALLDYKKPSQNQFAYRLRGYQEQWTYTKNHIISLFGLPYGQYELDIKGRGTSGEWNPIQLSIPVHVIRPYYLQAWFIASMILLAILTIWLTIRLRIRSLRRDRVRLEKEVGKRTQTIAKQTEQLKVLDKAKTRFFSNITHELRTPLTLISGPLEQVINELPSPSIFKRRLHGILKNSRHLLNLINQMLDLSKIESGYMRIEVTRGDIIAYTQDLTRRFEVLSNKKGQRLNFVTNLESWKTHFDKDKWDKIVYNLLSNAIKFTPSGGSIQVNLLKLEKENREFIRLDIKDTGIGISKAEYSQVFDRFYQADSSSTRIKGGTGIGLALVKELTEMQGGELTLSSEIGKGTTFEIRLPVLEAGNRLPLVSKSITKLVIPNFLEELENTTTIPKVSPNGQSKLELLLIEDNEEMREYIRYCLDTSKYNITEAENGEEGIEKAKALIPDLIISDVMMPKKNGFEVTEMIRNDIRTSHIPLILLTAKASLESRLKGLQRGADNYLTKPFSPQELAIRTQKLIEIRQLLQRRYANNTNFFKDTTYQKEDEFIVNLRKYILENIDSSDLNGDRIGRHFGMSRTNLYRKLKALTNQSISELVKSVRLNRAMELINEGSLNITEIAYSTGFSTLSIFSRSFKEMFGKAPSEIKKTV